MQSKLVGVLLWVMLSAGCGGDFGTSAVGPGGGPGGTPGGAQDIGYARDVIAQGGVPSPSAITVEGLLSEHDIPALGRAPSLETGAMEYWVQIGMTSGLGDFVRPPLDVVVVIDKSASMSIDMAETNEAVTHLIDRLTRDDRIGIVAFDSSVRSIKDFGPVGDKEYWKARVMDIRASGGSDLSQGTARGYEILRGVGDDPGRMRRVVVFSCSYPSLSDRLDDAYSQMVLRGGRDGIGLSFFGVLLGYHHSLAKLTGEAWGGAYGYLESRDKVIQVFDEDFDTMMTPVAYDLRFRLGLDPGFEITRLYGIPGDTEGAARPELHVATAFLSRRRGAIVARLRRTDPAATRVGTTELSYLPESALGFTAAEEQIHEIRHPEGLDEEDLYYQGVGVRKAVALVNMAEAMKAACDQYHQGSRTAAADTVRELIDYLSAERDALQDAALDVEIALVTKLLSNMGG